MTNAHNFILNKLKDRVDNGSLRRLSTSSPPIDFCSNDYLGFARSEELRKAIYKETTILPVANNGSGGSRLLSGNTQYIEETELHVAKFHKAEAGLIFNSGYDANIGLLSSLGQKGDTFLCDELIHASLIDGVRLTHANRYTFRHNDLQHLEEKLKLCKGIVYVIVESVYSMDGDIAPLLEISTICQLYNANLIVDEAHATGIFGERGQGLVHALNLEEQVFARVVTFGKAIGCHGAIVLGSKTLREYLINFARSFIYTTAAPIHSIISISCAYHLLENQNHADEINSKINHFARLISVYNLTAVKPSPSAIQGISVAGNLRAKKASGILQAQGFDVRPILSPTVPLGKERIRICLHTYNTNEDIENLIRAIKKLTTNE